MTRGPDQARRTLILSPMLVLALTLTLSVAREPASADPPVPAWNLAMLMAGMRTVHQATGSFVEQKFVQMLKQPLQSSGRLIYVAPDRLQKQTLVPAPSDLIVNGDRLTVQQPDGKTREVSLSGFPEIGALIESIRATLAGDTATLSRYYTATLTGTADDWSLQLEPRDPRLSKLLTMVRIQGEGTNIRTVETLERDGDRTDMTITPESE
ncbi:MAG TPA: LolA-related protein [Acetobacteraceae bacterium]|jgi:outer membrane lipoprotein-sorting protein|nr:LolA-related protein [Acetobacteraceae bacterium]